MRIGVLGPTTAVAGERELELGGRKQRSVLAALALHPGRLVTADALVDLVWGERPPATASATLQTYVAGLRRALEPDRAARAPGSVLVTVDRAYALRLQPGALDATALSSEVTDVHRLLGPLEPQLSGRDVAASSLPTTEVLTACVERLDAVLAAWRGEPYTDLPDTADVVADRVRLAELRLLALEDRCLALLALGEHAPVVAATERAGAADPLRERLRALHVVALVRSGRQADALAALRETRRLLADELGLDPGPGLQELEQRVLRQEVGRAPVPPAVPVVAVAPAVSTGWPTVGRDGERAALRSVLDTAAGGVPSFALLVGEPGIGKTRLVEDVTAAARSGGWTVAVGQCADAGAVPPLWPWVTALRALPPGPAVEAALAEVAPRPAVDAPGGRPSLAAETVCAALEEASAGERVLLVLEDLHWADVATLRVLRSVVAVRSGRLAVVLTRRRHPAPEGALAEAGEALARRHALRLELQGLAVSDAGTLLGALSGRELAPALVDAWHTRTEGNPFFLVELAHLAADGGAEHDARPPAAVRDVVLQRVAALPAPTRELLRLAAVVGPDVRLDVVAAAAGQTPDAALDVLEPALRAGLLVDRAADRLGFSHALVRDCLLDELLPTRRARLHAAVAQALEDVPGRGEQRTAELARHWLAAGPAHAERAWTSAVAAADAARSVHAHEDAAVLRAAALGAMAQDPAATARQRYDLLLQRAGDCQAAADWAGVEAAIVEAVALARRLGDPAAVGEAAAAMTTGALWTPHEAGVVLADVVDDLRWALGALPADDSAARCRLLLSLGVELYDVPDTTAERDALADEGVALARRLADPGLRWWACCAAAIATWRPSRSPYRHDLLLEALDSARAADDPVREAVSLAVLACSSAELGRLAEADEPRRRARSLATRYRLPYVHLALGFLELTVAALSGDEVEAGRLATEVLELLPRVAIPAREGSAAAAVVLPAMWSDRAGEVADMVLGQGAGHLREAASLVQVLLVRAGRLEQARAIEGEHTALDARESWGSSFQWCLEAEIAHALGDRDSGADVYRRLSPLSGRFAMPGASVLHGPVDGYLALAAAVAGEAEVARRHADAALESADRVGFSAYATWLRRLRAGGGF